METRVCTVFQNGSCLVEAAGVVDGGYGRQRAANDFLCSVGHPLQSLSVNSIQFNSIQFYLYSAKLQQLSSQGTLNNMVQFKPIGIQFIVIII